MTNKLTKDERQPIILHLNGVLDAAAKLMTAQKINREQMLIIDNALAIIRHALGIETGAIMSWALIFVETFGLGRIV